MKLQIKFATLLVLLLLVSSNNSYSQTPLDPEMDLEQLLKEAKQGDVDAQIFLGMMYEMAMGYLKTIPKP